MTYPTYEQTKRAEKLVGDIADARRILASPDMTPLQRENVEEAIKDVGLDHVRQHVERSMPAPEPVLGCSMLVLANAMQREW